MDKVTEKFIQSVIHVRKQKKMTQEQLGNLIGVKKSQICRFETSKGDLMFYTVKRLIEALDLEVVLTKEGIVVKSII